VKEFRQVWRQEQKFLRRYASVPEMRPGQMLEDRAPQKLMETIHTAFVKAFGVVFDKGDSVIAKVGRQELRQEKFQLNRFAAELREDKRSLRAFSKEADRAGKCIDLRCCRHRHGTVRCCTAGCAAVYGDAAQMRV
jgi:hypothetical protein